MIKTTKLNHFAIPILVASVFLLLGLGSGRCFFYSGDRGMEERSAVNVTLCEPKLEDCSIIADEIVIGQGFAVWNNAVVRIKAKVIKVNCSSLPLMGSLAFEGSYESSTIVFCRDFLISNNHNNIASDCDFGFRGIQSSIKVSNLGATCPLIPAYDGFDSPHNMTISFCNSQVEILPMQDSANATAMALTLYGSEVTFASGVPAINGLTALESKLHFCSDVEICRSNIRGTEIESAQQVSISDSKILNSRIAVLETLVSNCEIEGCFVECKGFTVESEMKAFESIIYTDGMRCTAGAKVSLLASVVFSNEFSWLGAADILSIKSSILMHSAIPQTYEYIKVKSRNWTGIRDSFVEGQLPSVIPAGVRFKDFYCLITDDRMLKTSIVLRNEQKNMKLCRDYTAEARGSMVSYCKSIISFRWFARDLKSALVDGACEPKSMEEAIHEVIEGE